MNDPSPQNRKGGLYISVALVLFGALMAWLFGGCANSGALKSDWHWADSSFSEVTPIGSIVWARELRNTEIRATVRLVVFAGAPVVLDGLTEKWCQTRAVQGDRAWAGFFPDRSVCVAVRRLPMIKDGRLHFSLQTEKAVFFSVQERGGKVGKYLVLGRVAGGSRSPVSGDMFLMVESLIRLIRSGALDSS